MIIDEFVELAHPRCKGRSLAEIQVGLLFAIMILVLSYEMWFNNPTA